MRIVPILLFLIWTVVSACAPSYKPFPPTVMDGIDHNFDFARWRMTPNEDEANKVQLGGRIVEVQPAGDMVRIVVSQLPIVERPAYGPRDTGQANGQFVVLYSGRIGERFLQSGNRIVIVGKTTSAKMTSVRGISKILPALQAECMHIWATGGREIEEFPHMEAGYVTLDEETVCIRNP